jgi:TP901 family phage tail tape measure protein
MATEKIGLEAVLRDADFQRGLTAYLTGVNTASTKTEQGAEKMSLMQRASVALGTSLGTGVGVALNAVSVGLGIAIEKMAEFGLSAIKNGLNTTFAWGGQLDTLGDQFGFSGEKASAFTFLANKMGLSIDELGPGLRGMINGLQGIDERLKTGGKTLSPFEKALSKIGVSAFDSKGKLKTFDALLPQLMDKFSKLPPGVEASALAMDLFGARSGGKFLDFLRQGSAGLDDADKKAREFGLSMSTDGVNAVEEFGFAQNELNLALKGLWNQVGVALLPVLKDLNAFIQKEILPAFQKWAKDNAPLITQALRDLGKWIMETGLPALRQFADWFTKEGIPALKGLWEFIQTSVIPALKNLQTFLSTPPNTAGWTSAFAKIIKFLEPVLKELAKFWKEIEPKLQKAWKNIVYWVKWAWDQIWKTIQPIVIKIEKFIEDHFEEIAEIINGVWKEIEGAVKVAWAIIKGIIKVALDILSGDFEEAGKDWEQMMQEIWDGIKQIFSGAWDILKNIVTLGLAAVLNIIVAKYNELKNAVTKPFTDAITYLQGINWAGIASAMVNAIVTALNNSASSVYNAIIKPFNDAIAWLNNATSAFFTAVRNIAQTMYDTANAFGTSIYNAIIQGVNNGLNWLRGAVNWFFNAVNDIVRTIYDTISAWSQSIYNAIFVPFSNAIDAIKRLLGIASPSKLMIAIGKQMAAGLQFGFGDPQLSFAAIGRGYPMMASPGVGGGGNSYGGATNNYYNMNVNTGANASTVISDFGILRSLAGRQ